MISQEENVFKLLSFFNMLLLLIDCVWNTERFVSFGAKCKMQSWIIQHKNNSFLLIASGWLDFKIQWNLFLRDTPKFSKKASLFSVEDYITKKSVVKGKMSLKATATENRFYCILWLIEELWIDISSYFNVNVLYREIYRRPPIFLLNFNCF